MLRGVLTFVVLVFVLLLFMPGILVLGLFGKGERFSSWSSYIWSRAILGCTGTRLRLEGEQKIPRGAPCFFIGNHQSALDIPILTVCLAGHVRFLAKESLFRIPVFGWTITSAGHIPIARHRPREARERLERMLSHMSNRPISLLVFPEGTRSPDGQLLPFRKGTMKICQRAGLTIVPFTIDGSLAVQKRGSLRINPRTVVVRFADPISPEEAAEMPTEQLHEKVYAAVAAGLAAPQAIACESAS